MSNRNDLIGWIRYDGKGVMIPGTLIYRRKKPAGKFKRLVDPSEPVCCIPKPSTGCATYWIDEITGGDVYPANVVIDSQCNRYSFFAYNGYGEQSFLAYVQKYAPDGALIWSKKLDIPFLPQPLAQYVAPMTFNIDSSDNLYGCLSTFYGADSAFFQVFKMDADGNIIWSKNYQRPDFAATYGTVLSKDESKLYLSTYGDVADTISVARLSTVDGSMIEVSDITLSGDLFMTAIEPGFCAIDSQDNLIFLNIVSTGTYGTSVITKVDSNSNVLWSKEFIPSNVIEPQSTWGYYLYEVRVDSQDNIIVSGYYSSYGVGKIDPNGNILWYKTIGYPGTGNTYPNIGDTVIDSENNIYLIGVVEGRNVNNTQDPTYHRLVCIKLTPAGSLVYTYYIDIPSTDVYLWWGYSLRNTFIKDKVITVLFGGFDITLSPEDIHASFVYNLPLDQPVYGPYGPVSINDASMNLDLTDNIPADFLSLTGSSTPSTLFTVTDSGVVVTDTTDYPVTKITDL